MAYLESLSRRPSGYPTREDRHPFRLDEIAASPLVRAADALPGWAIQHFPMLFRVRPKSDYYEDEELWLAPSQVVTINDEFRQLRAVCRRNEFITGLEGSVVYEHWRDRYEADAFEDWLRGLESVLELTIEADGVLLLLL